MSFIDRIASKIMPPESDEDRANARQLARSLAGEGDWLAIVLEQHQQIEDRFRRALTAGDAQARLAALRQLGVLLTGHANAEESVLYPALADAGEKADATMAYEEQAMTKIEMALLEKLDPMGPEWREKLEHIQGAVQHHVYEEEGTWFAKLQQHLPPAERPRLTRRFVEEFERYTQGQSQSTPPIQLAASQFGHDEPPMGK